MFSPERRRLIPLAVARAALAMCFTAWIDPGTPTLMPKDDLRNHTSGSLLKAFGMADRANLASGSIAIQFHIRQLFAPVQ